MTFWVDQMTNSEVKHENGADLKSYVPEAGAGSHRNFFFFDLFS